MIVISRISSTKIFFGKRTVFPVAIFSGIFTSLSMVPSEFVVIILCNTMMIFTKSPWTSSDLGHSSYASSFLLISHRSPYNNTIFLFTSPHFSFPLTTQCYSLILLISLSQRVLNTAHLSFYQLAYFLLVLLKWFNSLVVLFDF